MAEDNFLSVITNNERLLDGHKIVHLFKVNRLDVTEKSFNPLEYDTQCPIIPSSWLLEMDCERMEVDGDSFIFSIKLKRKDSSNHRVKASFSVLFCDANGGALLHPISSTKGRMICEDELQSSLDNILPSALVEVACVEVTIIIQNCHAGSDWQLCAPYLNIDKNRINLSKL
ncbi:hypothetical protein HNY73_006021 [Argiope bruennichi]|uniref:Uncharacterized protein n=1 Tax=Argiope bruennichi TaxID=94029 RepID=A0A8T0FIK7_ARGBR|nr:hypothetical protein HNY73_006021 [Argiope bruennichi]